MKNRKRAMPWLYSLPALMLIGIVIVFPILYTATVKGRFGFSLCDWCDTYMDCCEYGGSDGYRLLYRPGA